MYPGGRCHVRVGARSASRRRALRPRVRLARAKHLVISFMSLDSVSVGPALLAAPGVALSGRAAPVASPPGLMTIRSASGCASARAELASPPGLMTTSLNQSARRVSSSALEGSQPHSHPLHRSEPYQGSAACPVNGPISACLPVGVGGDGDRQLPQPDEILPSPVHHPRVPETCAGVGGSLKAAVIDPRLWLAPYAGTGVSVGRKLLAAAMVVGLVLGFRVDVLAERSGCLEGRPYCSIRWRR